MHNNSTKKTSIILAMTACIGKLLGFVKQSVIAWAFGANAATDIFFAADGYTSMLGQIMGQSLAPTVLTNYIHLNESTKADQAKLIVRQSFLFFGLLGLFLATLSILFSSTICSIIGISYTDDQLSKLEFFLVAMCPVIICTSLAGVAQGYLDANKNFIPAKLCSLFFSVSIISSVLLLKTDLGISSLLFGFVLGYVLHTLYMLLLSVPKIGLFLGNPFSNKEFIHLLKNFGPIVVGNSVIYIGNLTDRIVASSLAIGSVSALYYAQVISIDLVSAVIITPICTVLLTKLAESVAHDRNNVIDKVRHALIIITFFSGCTTALYFVEGSSLVTVAFERGSFSSNNSNTVSITSILYAFGFVFMAGREVLIRAHYAFQDTTSPMKNCIIGVITNLIGSIILSRIMGVFGIALATSISMVIVFIISLSTLKKHLGESIINKFITTNLLKIFISMLLSIIIGTLSHMFFIDSNVFIKIFFSSLTIVSFYSMFNFLLDEHVVKKVILKALLVKLKNIN